MKKTLLILLCAASGMSAALAAPRTAEQAKTLAARFFAEHAPATRSGSPEGNISLAATSAELQTLQPKTRQQTAADPAYYIYNQADNGFVIIAGDDRMPTILGYSFANAFSTATLPDNMRFWLNLYTLQQEQLETQGAAQEQDGTAAQQDGADNFAPTVQPLLGSISYDQGDPYNRLCPSVNGTRTWAGCVATAMASIMSYYEYPACGTGSHAYTSSTHKFDVSFDYDANPFDWNNILKSYAGGAYNAAQADAIANLLLACGVACNMNYDTSGSGSSVYYALEGLIQYLGYNPNAYCVRGSHCTRTEWINLIKTELNAQRPVYFTASDRSYSGHAFILDGYDEEGLMHVDWGWSGMSNGYFLVSQLQPSASGAGGGDGSGYEFDQVMIVNLAPQTLLTEGKESYLEAGSLTYNTSNRQFTANGIFNNARVFTGNIAVVAQTADGQLYPATTPLSTEGLKCGYGWNALNFSLNPSPLLTDGTYTLYLASQRSDSDVWTIATTEQGTSATYQLVISNGQATVQTAEPAGAAPEVTVEALTRLRSTQPATLRITIVNPRTDMDFQGQMELDVNDYQGNTLQSSRLQYVYLEPGDTLTLTRTITMPERQGSITLQPICSAGNQRNQVGTPLTGYMLPAGVEATGITSPDADLEQTTVTEGQTLRCSGTLQLVGADATFYEARLVASLYNNSTQQYMITSPEQYVNVTDEGREFSIDLDANVRPGRYLYILTAYNSTDPSRSQQIVRMNIRVTEANTGISHVQTDGGATLRLVPAGADEFVVDCPQEVKSLHLYDLQGRLISTAFSAQGATRYRVSAAGLPHGTYIIRATLADGSHAQTKCLH